MKAEEFKKRREELNLTQKELGLILGKHIITIRRYEYGRLLVPKSIEICMRYVDFNLLKNKS